MFTRKSTREFEQTPLNGETMEQINSFLAKITPLAPKMKCTYKIVGANEVKGLALPKALHYLLIFGEKHPLRNTNAGFIFQHFELFLNSLGLAARYLNSVKPKENAPDFIIGMAFGKPVNYAPRTIADFDRKTVAEIAQGTDSRLEAVRFAPSGINKQPWYFIVDNGTIHTYYKKKLDGLMGLAYNMTSFDIGLALCHLAVATEQEGKIFDFQIRKEEDVPTPPKNFIYVGTVENN
jgi:nitroreductase